jgi:hypothetical protein
MPHFKLTLTEGFQTKALGISISVYSIVVRRETPSQELKADVKAMAANGCGVDPVKRPKLSPSRVSSRRQVLEMKRPGGFPPGLPLL